MKENEFWKMQRELSFEFSRYILAHPEIEQKIPLDAQIVFQLENSPEFNSWAKETAEKQQEKGQPIVIVHIDNLVPPLESRLVNPKVELVSNI